VSNRAELFSPNRHALVIVFVHFSDQFQFGNRRQVTHHVIIIVIGILNVVVVVDLTCKQMSNKSAKLPSRHIRADICGTRPIGGVVGGHGPSVTKYRPTQFCQMPVKFAVLFL